MQMSQDNTLVLPRHPANSTNNDYVYMTLPLIAMASYFYGARPIGLCAVAVLVANLCDRLVAVMRHRPYDKTENSSISAALIVTLLMPASISYYILIITVIITVVIGKAAFGGWGAYPFSPPALGFSVAVLSWPDEVLRYPAPFAPLTLFGTESVTLQQSAAHTLAAGGMPNVSLFNLLLGNYPGSMGTTACVVLVACAAYLWMRKRITLAAPLGFLGACVAIAYFFPRIGGVGIAWPWQFVRLRLMIATYEILSGALLYAAVFLLNDETTLPKRQDARLLYGIVGGVGTMFFRYYGSFDMGVCFALLWVNVLSGPLDRWTSALAQRYPMKARTAKTATGDVVARKVHDQSFAGRKKSERPQRLQENNTAEQKAAVRSEQPACAPAQRAVQSNAAAKNAKAQSARRNDAARQAQSEQAQNQPAQTASQPKQSAPQKPENQLPCAPQGAAMPRGNAGVPLAQPNVPSGGAPLNPPNQQAQDGKKVRP